MQATPHLIGIAGPSCSGKSELAHWLADRLTAPIVSLDSYYNDLQGLTLEERARTNFDHPDSLDHLLIASHLRQLENGEPIHKPIYDFTCHMRAPECEVIRPAEYIVVEGLFSLYWAEVRPMLHTKVYVSVPDEVCFSRRLDRDVRERGRTPESVHWQYNTTVRPMAQQYIYPTAEFADLQVSGEVLLETSGGAVLDFIKNRF